MISKFKKHRRTIRPPFNAENLFLLGTTRMMFWRRSLRKKIVKHKRGSRSRRAQQHAVALAKEKSVPLDEVGFETRFHRRDGVFSDPHPTFAGIAGEVGGRAKEKCVPLDKVGFETTFHRRNGVFSDPHPTFAGFAGEIGGRAEEMDVVGGISTPCCSKSIEEPKVKEKTIPLDKVGFETGLHRQDEVFSDPHPMFAGIAAEVQSISEELDVVGGVSKTKHISTTHCSISSVGTRVDSPASYRSTGASVGATSQNPTDGIAAEVHGTSEEMDVVGGISKTKHISTTHCSIPSVGTRVDSPASYKSTGATVGATSQNPADGIAAEVHGTFEEMDVVGGVSKTNHISTTHCSIPTVGTREDSPVSYKSNGAIVGATSQNPTDGIAAKVNGTSEEMDVVGGISKTNHISTTHCSIPTVGTREDSPASYKSTGAIVGATSQNPTDGIAVSTDSSSGTYIRTSEDWALSEMENQLEMWREAQVHEQKTLSEGQQKIIATDVVINEMQRQLSWLQERVFEQKKVSVRLKKIIDEQKEEHEKMYQERVALVDELHFKQKLNDLFCDHEWKKNHS